MYLSRSFLKISYLAIILGHISCSKFFCRKGITDTDAMEVDDNMHSQKPLAHLKNIKIQTSPAGITEALRNDVVFKMFEKIFKMFSLQRTIAKFLTTEKSIDENLSNDLKHIITYDSSVLQNNHNISSFILDLIDDMTQFNDCTISLCWFIKAFEITLNILEKKYDFIKSEYTLYRQTVNTFVDFFGFCYEISGLDEEKKHKEGRFTEYGYSQTLDFFDKKISFKKPEEKYPDIFENLDISDIYENDTENYPYLLVINSDRNMEFFVENFYKADKRFRNVKFYKENYKFIGFIQVNKAEDDLNIYWIIENSLFVHDNQTKKDIRIDNIFESEFVDMKKQVIVFLEKY